MFVFLNNRGLDSGELGLQKGSSRMEDHALILT